MRIRLGWKLSITYLVLIVLALSAFGYFTMDFFQRSFLEDIKASYFTQASILANRSAPFLNGEEQNPLQDYLVTDFAERVGARFILVNRSGTVMADSLGEFKGKVLSHPEIITALAGENSANPRQEPEFGWVLYLAVPVNYNQQVNGAVFLSADINSLVERLDIIRQRLLAFSVLSGCGVFVVSLLLGRVLTQPLLRLSLAARKIAAGDYGFQVKGRRSRDEIGELIGVFNEMSTKIEQEDKIRKRFVADASHELRTPLAGLRALLDSWSSKHLNAHETEELIEDLKSETGRLARLVDDLLVLSRIEGSRRHLQKEDVSVGELIEAVRKAVLPMAEVNGVEVETLHQGIEYWFLDGDKMFRVLLNLVDNAVKYSVGPGRVVIGYRVQGDTLVIFVSNQGAGIPSEEIPHVFDRFYRVDKTRTRQTGGWGLGLAIVKEIVELHQGKVSIASHPGGETVVTIELPRET